MLVESVSFPPASFTSESYSSAGGELGKIEGHREHRAMDDVRAIKNAVEKLRKEHALAILLVEQYVDFCREVADRFYAMDRGAVVISGEISTLTDDVVKKHLQV